MICLFIITSPNCVKAGTRSCYDLYDPCYSDCVNNAAGSDWERAVYLNGCHYGCSRAQKRCFEFGGWIGTSRECASGTNEYFEGKKDLVHPINQRLLDVPSGSSPQDSL